jgi:hypothetical protein
MFCVLCFVLCVYFVPCALCLVPCALCFVFRLLSFVSCLSSLVFPFVLAFMIVSLGTCMYLGGLGAWWAGGLLSTFPPRTRRSRRPSAAKNRLASHHRFRIRVESCAAPPAPDSAIASLARPYCTLCWTRYPEKPQ